MYYGPKLSYVMLCYDILPSFQTCGQKGSKPAKKQGTSKVSQDTSWLVSAGAMAMGHMLHIISCIFHYVYDSTYDIDMI